MASELHVDAIKHSGGTSALTIDSSGNLTASANVHYTGGLIQLVSNTTTDTSSLASVNFLEFTALATSITPKFSSSKIFVTLNICIGNANDDNYNQFRLKRDSTEIGLGLSGQGGASQATFSNNGPYTHATYEIHSSSYSTLDSPNTTSQVTYKLFARAMATTTRTMLLNRSNDMNDTNRSTTTSTMTLMEIAQ
jgi:hypothetical protein